MRSLRMSLGYTLIVLLTTTAGAGVLAPPPLALTVQPETLEQLAYQPLLAWVYVRNESQTPLTIAWPSAPNLSVAIGEGTEQLAGQPRWLFHPILRADPPNVIVLAPDTELAVPVRLLTDYPLGLPAGTYELVVAYQPAGREAWKWNTTPSLRDVELRASVHLRLTEPVQSADRAALAVCQTYANPSAWLTLIDIRNPSRAVRRIGVDLTDLLVALATPQNPLQQAVVSQLSGEVEVALAQWVAREPRDPTVVLRLGQQVITELERLIDGPLLLDPTTLAQAELPSDTEDFVLASATAELGSRDLVGANRRLLADVFPLQLAPPVEVVPERWPDSAYVPWALNLSVEVAAREGDAEGCLTQLTRLRQADATDVLWSYAATEHVLPVLARSGRWATFGGLVTELADVVPWAPQAQAWLERLRQPATAPPAPIP